MLEWYDFTVYAFFAGYIAKSFFPAGNNSSNQLLQALFVFGLGFVVRPLGAIIIGNYADRAGRKAALTLTILLMGAGTAVIACAPTYESAGLWAPLLLLIGRLLQGFSAGGEIGGATAYLLESASLEQRGGVASWLEASMGMSNILGALVAYSVIDLLSPADVQAWGWRIPFWIGLCIVPVGWYLRRSLEETPDFKATAAAAQHASDQPRVPVLEIFRSHFQSVAVGFCFAILWAVATYVLMIFLPTYVQRSDTFGFSAQQAFGASLLGNVPFVIGCVLFGSLSDKIGRRTMLFISASLLCIGVVPMFMWLRAAPTFLNLVIMQSVVFTLVASFVGVAPAALSEIFPTRVRSTGTALVYNGAFTVFGGFAAYIVTWLRDHAGGSVLVPAWYVMGAAMIALTAIPFLRPSR